MSLGCLKILDPNFFFFYLITVLIFRDYVSNIKRKVLKHPITNKIENNSQNSLNIYTQ